MYYIGIDPGLKGKIAIIKDNEVLEVIGIPDRSQPEEFRNLFQKYYNKIGKKSKNIMIYLEKPIIKPMIGKKPCPKCKTPIVYQYQQKGIANSHINYGILLGVIIDKGIPYEEISSQEWKKYFNLIGEDKKSSIAKAKQLFPDATDLIGNNDNIAEAILIAEYGRRKHSS